MTSTTLGGKVTVRRSTRQRKAPANFDPSLKQQAAPTGSDTKDQIKSESDATSSANVSTTRIDEKPKNAKKAKSVTKKSPITKKAPATKKRSAVKEKLANPKTATIKKTTTAAEKQKKSKKAKVVKSLATYEEISLLPQLRGKIERLKREKLFVMSRSPLGPTEEEFEVIGSTGNLYMVLIGSQLSCTCRDFLHRRAHCKHILTILLKVFRLHPSSPIFTTLYPSLNTLHEIFSSRVPDPASFIPQELKAIIDRNIKSGPAQSGTKTARRPIDTSDCPVCCDEFDDTKIQDILFCRVCGNNIHAECFEMWKKTKLANITCVYCRSPWEEPVEVINKLKIGNEGYINLRQELGLPEKRDTSTYRAFPANR
ncbi:hypothetical protein BCR42DRAFT_407403 [Absidia repens]|uniref:SWIM-type domain-containing protein n=1 Tax=Absidia repens TaxID=90262 RepID=A0A1X2ISA4_9FUNG|nr:hypothetical protein BCR42DRAFT_407403 [Absidia repens]